MNKFWYFTELVLTPKGAFFLLKIRQRWYYGYFSTSIYQVLPKLIELWGLNMQTGVTAKKNLAQLTDRWRHHYFCLDAYILAYLFVTLICSRLVWSTICTQKAEMMNIKAIRRWLRNLTWMPFNRKFTAHIMTLYWRDTSMWVYCKPCGGCAYVSNKSEHPNG